MKTPVCRTCGGKVVNGNIYCSKLCGQAPKAVHAHLADSGFIQDPDTPNIYRKDGVAVTVEQVHYVGISKALRNHAHATEARRAGNGVRGAV